MATLAELRLAVFPAAAAVGDAVDLERLDRDVAWVRVARARVPAFDALEPGDVAILPPRSIAVIAPGEAEVAAIVDALADGGAVALLIPDPDGDPLPAWVLAAVRDRASATRLPAFRVAHAEPVALERSIIGFLVNRRAELEQQAARLEAALAELAIRAADLDALVAAVAGFFGRAVALEGPRGDLLAIHASPDTPGAGAAVAAYLGGNRAAALRVPLPGAVDAVDSALSGRLVLLGERPASELERVAGARVGRLLALELARSTARRREGTRRESLPPGGPPWVVLVARQVGTAAEREATREGVARLAPSRRLLLRGDADSVELRAVLAVSRDGDIGHEVAERMAADLRRSVAISRPFDQPSGRAQAEADARATLEAAEALAEPPPVAEAARLPAYRLLAALRSLPDGRRHAEALLAPLMAGPRDVRRERLATLRAVLEHPGLQEAAAQLGIHRNTLAYRIRRIEALTGWRLSDPTLRAPLALAVHMVRDVDERREERRTEPRTG